MPELVKQIWSLTISAIAIWGVGVFLLMFNYQRLGIEPHSLPGIVFGSALAVIVGSAAWVMGRRFLAR